MNATYGEPRISVTPSSIQESNQQSLKTLSPIGDPKGDLGIINRLLDLLFGRLIRHGWMLARLFELSVEEEVLCLVLAD